MTDKVNIMTEMGADAQTVSQAVAVKLKEHRDTQKLSLDELARLAGISKGMLVELEKGRANPSIAILCKVATALRLSVADIVNVTSPPAVHLVEAKDIPTLWSGPEGGNAQMLAGISGPNMFEIWRWKMKPGEVFQAHSYPHETFELFHVEEGELSLKIEDTKLLVSTGCSAVARTDVPHSYANEGKSILIFIMSILELRQ